MMGFAALTAAGQSIDTNQNPPGIKWKKIDTPHFEVIFPEEITFEGQRAANLMEHLYAPLSKTLETGPRRISIFLTNQGSIPNGYVALAPRMSEWFSPPPQSTFAGTNEWYNLLASHEGRHIVQFDKMNKGITKVAGVLFGEIGQMAFSVLLTPTWFWEGDAIDMETAISHSGRGRMPAFDMEIRTLLLSGERYSYYKAYLLSYRDWYPNHYYLGYLLTTHVRRDHGANVWSRVLDRATGFSFCPIPFAFSRALKKETGKGVTGIYEETMDELEALWREQLEGLSFTHARILNTEKKKVWTSYQLPQYMPDGSVIAAKYGMADPAKLVRLTPDGKEHEIEHFSPATTFSTNGGMIVWDEIRYEPRWLARSYSVIVTHNPDTGKTKQITEKTRFYAPAISPDGNHIAVVEFTPERKCSLVILDAKDGSEVKRFLNPENEFIRNPSWSPDGKRIVFIRHKHKGVAITIADTQTGQTRDVIPHSWEDISYPVLCGDYVLYGSYYSGIDNIYAIDLSTDQRYQVTSRKFGAFNPAVSPDGDKLLFEEYQVKGYDVAEMSLEPSTWKEIEEIEDRSIRYYEPLIAQEQGGSILDEESIPDVTYEVKDYSTFTHLFNFHSWFIVPTLPVGTLGIYSNDKLNTMSLQAGLNYNVNEKVMSGSLDLSYGGFFPILDAGVSYGGRASTYEDESDEDKWDTWDETSARLGIRVPLNLSKGIHRSALEMGISAAFTDISNKTYVEEFDSGNGSLMPLTYSLSYDRSRQASIRDLYPRWRQAARISYSHTPVKSDYNGSIISSRARLFFPGFLKHHSLRVEGAYERQEPDNYRFESELLFPRGYGYKYHDDLYKASFNYSFPIAYPDFSLGPIFYLKRIRANLFYDHGIGRDRGANTLYNSVGVELSADFNIFTLPIPVDLGARYSYRLKDDEYRIEPVLFELSF